MTRSYLLDTHIVIWWFLADKRLPKLTIDLLENKANTLLLSTVSLHEFAIKDGLGQMPVSSQQLQKSCQKTGVEILNFDYEDMVGLAGLPKLHADPFDRAQIAQSLARNMPLISADPAFSLYRSQGLRLLI